MPIRGAVLTPTEVLLAREACEPLLLSVTDRLLRGGLAGFAEFRRRYVVECQRAMSATTENSNARSRSSTSTTGTTPAEAGFFTPATNGDGGQRVARRVNPEGLKTVLAQSGVLLSPEEYRSILIAYRDAVGFVLAEDLLADLHPCRRVPLDLIHACTGAVADGLFLDLPMVESKASAANNDVRDLDFPAVTVGSVCAALTAVFDPALSDEEAAPLAADPSSAAACVSALTSLQAGVEATFIEAVYPDGAVPAEDVVAFVVLSLQQHPHVSAIAFARLRQAKSLTAAPPPADAAATSSRRAGITSVFAGIDGATLFSIRHSGVTTQRKFEYYSDNADRRDEWMLGRREADARSGYLRHTVGYGGHLPEYQYRFGRTFHVIEEDLPQLTKPKAPLEPVPADWYGEGVELKDSRMNAHHYRFA
ncbi:hypothetical protein ABB37_05301 [Leptomonas pyrrhocoris]|uniref:Uncharacterized protein n=1 Tax=Leptomonas pyrrhocoris TaxID=157538 RepID=A0A0M9G054_LEPPY|nr:hypothetical protein ABB37_05301 [Leptomonas pyrrhocoris]XP_015657907.1 hypothetical protein ABB37_05301 [Leptomonas pyrrhocoris]KPA79467.1 hypothetical protein ABB37_05301 [Leptomonas pyrrhocoris]KPA79468.1 hypothetical protein ABB37_05301 [Leptomonas pyrrhocoris]|eukprot:XP_015657906.1 hypothetical protein ABB37_05301 [Leptomonas pyrrhocoris]